MGNAEYMGGAAFLNKTVSSTRVSMLESSCVALLSLAKNLVDRVGETVIQSIGQAALASLFIQNIFNMDTSSPESAYASCTVQILSFWRMSSNPYPGKEA